jgi:hypothetical protein
VVLCSPHNAARVTLFPPRSQISACILGTPAGCSLSCAAGGSEPQGCVLAYNTQSCPRSVLTGKSLHHPAALAVSSSRTIPQLPYVQTSTLNLTSNQIISHPTRSSKRVMYATYDYCRKKGPTERSASRHAFAVHSPEMIFHTLRFPTHGAIQRFHIQSSLMATSVLSQRICGTSCSAPTQVQWHDVDSRTLWKLL